MKAFNQNKTYTGESNQTSYYNESWMKTLRLAQCWNNANYYKRRGNIRKWKDELDIAFDELSSDAKIILTKPDYENYVEQKLKTANLKIIKAEKENQVAKICYWLRFKERIIRHIQNLTGRGTKIIEKKDVGRAILMEE